MNDSDVEDIVWRVWKGCRGKTVAFQALLMEEYKRLPKCTLTCTIEPEYVKVIFSTDGLCNWKFLKIYTMITKVFPFNPVIKCMTYNGPNSELTIDFKNGDIKTYGEVPKELFYKMYHKTDLSEMLSLYHQEFRKKFTVVKSNKK